MYILHRLVSENNILREYDPGHRCPQGQASCSTLSTPSTDVAELHSFVAQHAGKLVCVKTGVTDLPPSYTVCEPVCWICICLFLPDCLAVGENDLSQDFTDPSCCQIMNSICMVQINRGKANYKLKSLESPSPSPFILFQHKCRGCCKLCKLLIEIWHFYYIGHWKSCKTKAQITQGHSSSVDIPKT